MITKTILGATAAAFIAAASLGVSTNSASATGIYVGYNGYNGNQHHGYKVCKPIYKKISWHDRWGNWHTSVKLVDYTCWYQHRDHDWDGGYSGGYGGWNNY